MGSDTQPTLEEQFEKLEKVYKDTKDKYFHVGKNLPFLEKV